MRSLSPSLLGVRPPMSVLPSTPTQDFLSWRYTTQTFCHCRHCTGKSAPLRKPSPYRSNIIGSGTCEYMVTQILRQGDAEVFNLYSQAKLGMMREALAKLDRKENERPGNSFTEWPS